VWQASATPLTSHFCEGCGRAGFEVYCGHNAVMNFRLPDVLFARTEMLILDGVLRIRKY
jgi:hypothetical protein